MNIVSNILFNSIKKIGLKYWIINPILGIVAVISLCATIIFIGEIINPTGHVHIYYQTHDGYYQARLLIKKLTNIKDISNFSFVAKEKIRADNLILLTKGNTVPFDGIIVKGACYVNESDLTGILF